jgi:cytochrome c-type protein NapC
MSQSNPGDAGSKAGWWSALRRPAAKWSLLSLLLVGVTSGILFWGGFNTGDGDATNTLEFCIGCHEMRDNVYAEYKQHHPLLQPHRRAGDCLRLPCAEGLDAQDDPQDPGEQGGLGQAAGQHRHARKVRGAPRLELAEREWARMKARDSRECRNCHNFDFVECRAEGRRSAKMHMTG